MLRTCAMLRKSSHELQEWLGRYRENPGHSRQRRGADQECRGNEAKKEGERANPRQQHRKHTRSLKHPSKLKTPPNNGMSAVPQADRPTQASQDTVDIRFLSSVVRICFAAIRSSFLRCAVSAGQFESNCNIPFTICWEYLVTNSCTNKRKTTVTLI